MPYNSEASEYERRSTTVIDATPDGDTVAVAIDVKLDQGIDDYVTDINHHAANGNHYPATSVHTDSRFLKQSPAGVVSWADGVVAADAALKDFSNVASGAIANDKLAAIAPAKITQDASNRFMTDAERAKITALKTAAYLDILGTVSQSGGVPTGAIIERGSNANGSYVRFADGTQICHFDGTDPNYATTASGSIYIGNGSVTWTFPAVFATVTDLFSSASGQSDGVRWFNCRVVNTQTASITRYSSISDSSARTFRALAVGRWF